MGVIFLVAAVAVSVAGVYLLWEIESYEKKHGNRK